MGCRVWLLPLGLMLACAGDDASDTGASPAGTGSSTSGASSSSGVGSGSGTSGTESGTPGSSSGGASSTAADSTTGSPGAACFPEGIYGSCAENTDCQCLQGATVYQVCTRSCTSDDECGDPADFPGAMPGCFPLNPGAADMICALVCVSPDDCPCGLSCMPSGVPNVNICSELQ